MSQYDYEESKEITSRRYQFYALIMAAMRQADTDNAEALAVAFPEVYAELQARHNAPEGPTTNELLISPDLVVRGDSEAK